MQDGAAQISQNEIPRRDWDRHEDHIYAMGKKNTIQSRTVTVAAGGGATSQAGGQLPVSGLDKQDAVALQARIDELTVKIQRRDDELAEEQQRLAAMEQARLASDKS